MEHVPLQPLTNTVSGVKMSPEPVKPLDSLHIPHAASLHAHDQPGGSKRGLGGTRLPFLVPT